jgi:hypothetical protein
MSKFEETKKHRGGWEYDKEEIVTVVRVIVGPDLLEDVIVPFSRKYGNIERG